MSSKVEINGRVCRPSFNHAGEGQNGLVSHAEGTAELCESMRNVCEDMDYTLKSVDNALGSIACVLRRIDRRLAADHKLRGRAKGEAR